MAFRNVRFALAQIALAVSLAGIVLSAGVLIWYSRGTSEYWVSTVAFSSDGKRLAASLYAYRNLQVWQPTPRVLGADASHSFYLLDLPDLSEQELLACTTRPGTINVTWPVRKLGLGQSLAFSPDGTMLATIGLEDTISIWNVRSGKKIRDLTAAENLSGGVSWSEDGTLAATAANGCYVMRPGDLATLEKSIMNALTRQPNVVSVTLSRDGSKLVTADDDSKIELWDAHSAVRLHELWAGKYSFFKASLAISPDGNLIAGGVGGNDSHGGHGIVRVWDAVSGEKRFTWSTPLPILAVAFSSDGTTLAASGDVGELDLLDLNGRLLKSIKTEGWVAAVAFSPNGKLLAAGDSKGQLYLWDVETKKLLRRVQLHQESGVSHWLYLIFASMIWVIAWLYFRRKQKMRLSENP